MAALKLQPLNFILAFCFFTLIGCGDATKTSAKLQITSGFAVSSAGFDGGLVIVGKSSAGSFSQFLTSGTQITLQLPKAEWEFSAVGWGTAELLGNPYCGFTTANLTNPDETVNINVTEANCANTHFGSPEFHLTNSFYPIEVETCKALYDGETPITAANATGFCVSHDPDFAKWAKGIRISILQKDLLGNTSSSSFSNCQTGAAPPQTTTLSFPTKNLPIRIELFRDQSCDGIPKVIYDMFEGIEGSYGFDKLAGQDISKTRIILPFNDLKKGYSPFFILRPYFKCNTGSVFCTTQPASPPVDQYFIHSFGGSQSIKLAEEGVSCNDINITSTHANLTLNNCSERRSGVYFDATEATAGDCAASCNFSYTINGGSAINRTVTSNASYADVVELYNQLWRLIGNNDSPNLIFNFYDHSDEHYGRLSRIRETLGPGGPASVLAGNTCSDASGLVSSSFFEDGEYKNFQVEVTTSSKAIPKFLCDNGNSGVSACSNSTFDKKIIVRELVGYIYEAVEVLHVDCDNKIGIREDRSNETFDSNQTRSERSLLGWNAQQDGTSRFEYLTYHAEYNSSNTLANLWTSFERTEKTSATSFIGHTFHLNSRFNGTDYEEHLTQSEYFGDTVPYINSFRKGVRLTGSQNAGDIFGSGLFSQGLKLPSILKETAYATNSNGDMVIVWITDDAGTKRLYMSLYSQSTGTWAHPTSSADYISNPDVNPSTYPAVSMNDNGDYVITWLQISSGFNTVFRRKGNVSTSLDSAVAVTHNGPTSSSQGVGVCSEGSDSVIVWSQDVGSAQDKLFYSYSSDTNTIWSSPTDETYSFSDAVAKTPKCLIKNGKVFITWTNAANNAFIAYANLGSISNATLFSSIINFNTTHSSGPILETYIGLNANDEVIVSASDTTRLLESKFNASWTHREILNSHFLDSSHCRTTENFSTVPSACSPVPVTLKMPHFNSSLGSFHFGLERINPSILLQSFTPDSTFKNQ